MSDADTVLIERWIATRDAEAFAEVVMRHSGMVYGTCRRILGNASEAEDVAQECFIELARLRKPIAPSLAGWLHTVARHRSLDRIKTGKRRRRREARFAAGMRVSAEMSWDDVEGYIDEAIADLPDELRPLIIRRFLEGESLEAVSGDLDIPRSTVQYRLGKGVEAIREHLKRRGVPVATAALTAMLCSRTVEAAPATLTATLGKLALSGISTGATTSTVATGNLVAVGSIAVIAALVYSLGNWPEKGVNQQLSQAPVKVTSPIPAPTEEPAQAAEVVPTPNEGTNEDAQEGDAFVEFPDRTTVTGRVVDGRGNPVRDALVTARAEGGEMKREDGVLLSPQVAGDRTDSDGQFRVKVSWGRLNLHISASATGYVGGSKSVYVPKEGLDGLELVLEQGGSISGRVVDTQGRPVPYMIVDSGRGSSKPTGPDGVFSIVGLNTGEYILKARYAPPSRGSASWSDVASTGTTVKLQRGQQLTGVEVVFLWDQDMAVAGRVINEDGQPVVGASVRAELYRGRVREALSATDAEGRFRIEYIGFDWTARVSDDTENSRPQPQFVSLVCNCSGYEDGSLKYVAVGTMDAELVLLRLRRGTIKGFVLDAVSRRPIQNAQVSCRVESTEWGGRAAGPSERWALGTVEADGSFTIEDVPAGSSTLLARAREYGLAIEGGILVRTGETTEVEMLLARAGTLQVNVRYAGHLEESEGRCLITCRPAGESETRWASAYDSPRTLIPATLSAPAMEGPGVYEATLQPGEYDIRVSTGNAPVPEKRQARTRLSRIVQARVDSGRTTTVDVEFGGTGVISGQVPGQEDEHMAFLVLTPGQDNSAVRDLKNPEGEGAQLAIVEAYGEAQFTTAWPENHYTFDCVPAGTYTLTTLAMRESDGVFHERGSRTIEVKPDEILTVDFP